jgi:predicted ArsR family transcriptional regulator
MFHFTKRFVQSTRGQIVMLLRNGARTVNDLAQALQLTDNAIRAHLATLERDGFVQPSGFRSGWRKPHVLYSLSEEGKALFPKAYATLLDQLLDVLKEKFSEKKTDALLREVGRRLAEASNPKAERTFESRLNEAIAIFGQLGGTVRLEERDRHLFIQGNDCPLANLSVKHAEICGMAEALLTEILQKRVRQCCKRSGSPQCCFEIEDGA